MPCFILLVLLFFPIYTRILIKDGIRCVMVSVLISTAVHRNFEFLSEQAKLLGIGICCFYYKDTTLKSKRKDWLARNHDTVS